MKFIEKFADLIGEDILSVEQKEVYEGDELHITLTDGRVFKLYHNQDCCESVTIESITGGELSDLKGTVTLADEASNQGFDEDSYDSETWTFYRLQTSGPLVTIRWHGISNGEYSESVDFNEVKL